MKSENIKKNLIFPRKRKNISQKNRKNRQKNHQMRMNTFGNASRKSKHQNINPKIRESEGNNQ